jgi:hypothetical protein
VITSVIFIFVLPLGGISMLQYTPDSADVDKVLWALVGGCVIFILPLLLLFLSFLIPATRNTDGKAIPCRAYAALELVILSFFVTASLAVFEATITDRIVTRNDYFRSGNRYLNIGSFDQDCNKRQKEVRDAVNKIVLELRKQSKEANDRETTERNENLTAIYHNECNKICRTLDSISHWENRFSNVSYNGIYPGTLLLFLLPLASVGMGLGINFLTTKNTEGRVPAWFAALIHPVLAVGIGVFAFFDWFVRLPSQTAIAVAIVLIAIVIFVIGILLVVSIFYRRNCRIEEKT